MRDGGVACMRMCVLARVLACVYGRGTHYQNRMNDSSWRTMMNHEQRLKTLAPRGYVGVHRFCFLTCLGKLLFWGGCGAAHGSIAKHEFRDHIQSFDS